MAWHDVLLCFLLGKKRLQTVCANMYAALRMFAAFAYVYGFFVRLGIFRMFTAFVHVVQLLRTYTDFAHIVQLLRTYTVFLHDVQCGKS